MEKQNKTRIKINRRSVSKLFVGWLIVLVVYILIRIVFIMFGFNLSTAALGSCLATIPYFFCALFFWIKQPCQNGWFYGFGILLPSIIEKIVLYLMGAFLYNISLANIADVLEAISSQKPFVNHFTQPAARYILNISFLSWPYVSCGMVVSALLVFLLTNFQKRKT